METLSGVIHLFTAVAIVGGYVTLGTVLTPLVAARFDPTGRRVQTLKTSGRAFFLGCAAYHAVTHTLFAAGRLPEAGTHTVLHLLEVVQAWGAAAFITAAIRARDDA